MLSEEQKHYTGRAMLALAAAQSEMMKAVAELMKHDVQRAEEIARSAARNMEQCAGLLSLVPHTTGWVPPTIELAESPAIERTTATSL